MGTLIYSPAVTIRIATADGTIYDVSSDVADFSVDRELGISSASMTLTNSGRKYDGVFTAMDRIVIYQRRFTTLLTFSGYLDQIPVFSTYAKSVVLRASCSAKRLQHFHWDPTTGASVALMQPDQQTASNTITDGGVSARAIKLLNKVAGWPLAQIHIGAIPTNWMVKVSAVADKLSKEADLATAIGVLGSGASLYGTNPAGGASQTVPGIVGQGPGTGSLPDQHGRASQFGGPTGGAFGAMALTGEPGGIPDSQRARWGGPYYCLPGRALVYTDHGPVPIKDVRSGDLVWSFDGRGLGLHPVTGWAETGVKPLWRITTKNTRLDSTEDHRVLVLARADRRRGKSGKPSRLPAGGHSARFEWLRADEVRPGDVVVTTGDIPESTDGAAEYPSAEIAELVGLVVADGTRNTRYTATGGPCRFNLCMPIREHKDHWIPRLTDAGIEAREQFDSSGRPRCCITFRTDLLQPWCADVMREKSPDRFVPAWIWTSPGKIQAAFLRGYMAGDGSVGQLERTQGTQTISCTSSRLVEELRVLCHYLGYRTGNLGGYEAGSGSFPNARRMYRFVFYVEPTRHRVPTTYAKRGLDLDSTLAGRTVLSSRLTGTMEATYDIEIAGTESFVADGVVVHNCAMRWPYVVYNQNDRLVPNRGVTDIGACIKWWATKRILVVSKDTGRAVVVRAADWGPGSGGNAALASADSRIIDLSAAAMKALGIGTDQDVSVAFAADNQPLGPVDTSSGAKIAADPSLKAGLSASSSVTATTPKSALNFLAIATDTILKGHPAYIYGASASITDPYPRAFDCSELVQWATHRCGLGSLMDGTAYTQFVNSQRITPDEARKTKGALLFMNSGGAPNNNNTHHVAISRGDGTTIEARSTRDGTGSFSANIPEFNYAGLIRGMDYSNAAGPGTGGVVSGASSADPYGGASGAPVGPSFGTSLINAYDWLGSTDFGGDLLTGVRALMNDVPIYGAFDDLMSAGLRHWCSAPNGDIIGWFPDYFGHYGTAAKMIIHDIELHEPFTIAQSDDRLKTHMFVTGSTSGLEGLGDASTVYQLTATAGIASVEFPELMAALFNVDPKTFADSGKAFLSRYGARPDNHPMNNISGHKQEFYFACFRFMQNWSDQWSCQVSLTYMPEVYPGMLLLFPSFGLQGYVQSVRHSGSPGTDNSGFKTDVTITAWSTIGKTSVVPGLTIGAPL